MNTTATNRKIRVLLKAIREKTLIPQPEFQRRLVWSNRHKQAFLDTVVQGYPFPEIYIAAGEVDPITGEGTELLVDGQQRITTLNQYFVGSSDLRLKDFPSYAELTEDQQKAFLEYEVVVRDLGAMPIGEIIEVFSRINSTKYALNAMEVHNARYDGEMKRFAEKLAGDEFFENHRVFTSTEARRMNDVRFTLVLIVTLMSTYFNRDEELETYLQKYNDTFPQRNDVRARLRTVFKLIDDAGFEPKSRAWQKADLLTLLVETDHAVNKNQVELTPGSIHKRLNTFYAEVDRAAAGRRVRRNASAYHRAAIQASNDRSSRIARGEILYQVLVTPAASTASRK
jgi:hypothetical protein